MRASGGPDRRDRQAHRPRLAGRGRGDRAGAREGELVEAEQVGPARAHGLPRARVIARLGDPSAPRSVSLIAIHEHGIPDAFPEEALAEAAAAKPGAALGQREDLRALPLVTIDPSDARDHDDAVFAQADDDPANPGGHVVWVAIADVAALRRPGRPRPRGAEARQLDLLPRPRGADAAGAALGRPLLAGRRGTGRASPSGS